MSKPAPQLDGAMTLHATWGDSKAHMAHIVVSSTMPHVSMPHASLKADYMRNQPHRKGETHHK